MKDILIRDVYVRVCDSDVCDETGSLVTPIVCLWWISRESVFRFVSCGLFLVMMFVMMLIMFVLWNYGEIIRSKIDIWIFVCVVLLLRLHTTAALYQSFKKW